MARSSMGLTLADLEILRQMLIQQPRSHSAAAELAGVNRPRLARLIQRVNDHIGEDLDWRSEGRFRPPPEVRRLVAKYAVFASELDELGHAPLVSAGTSAMLLLVEVLGVLGRELQRVSVVRSRDIWRALESDEIDIAIAHGRLVGLEPGVTQKAFGSGLVSHTLVEWQAVLVKHSDASVGARARFLPVWEPGSTGDHLDRATGHLMYTQALADAGIPCQSFLHALEMVRRGLVPFVVIPDIYVPKEAVDLVQEPTPLPLRDQLVALFRADELARWAWLIDKSAWLQVTTINPQSRVAPSPGWNG